MSELKKYEGICPTCKGTGHVPFAYAAVIMDGGRFGIGRADWNTSGYTPMSEHGSFKSYKDASDKAHELNQANGLPDNMAALIIAQSMRDRPQRDGEEG